MISRLLLLATASELLYALLGWSSRAPPGKSPLASWYQAAGFEQTPTFLALWAGLFLFYALAVGAVGRKESRGALVLVLLASALFRGTLLYQGRWDESVPRASLQSRSPLHEVDGALTAALEDSGRAPFPLRKVAISLVDLGTVALVPGLLRGASLGSPLALVYGWNPLVVKEVAGNGRIEAVAIFFFVLALRLMRRERRALAALAYGLSLTGPILGFLPTLPLFALALGLRALVSIVVAGAGWGLLAISSPPAELLGWPPADWTGGSLFPALSTLSALFLTRNPLVAPVLAVGTLLAVAVFRALAMKRGSSSLHREALLVAGLSLALAPQVLPSSFLLVAALAAFSGNRGWLVFTATAPLAYFGWSGRSWSFWLGFAQYFPAYAISIYSWLGGKGRPGKLAPDTSPRWTRKKRERRS